jgi:hypothetical protein
MRRPIAFRAFLIATLVAALAEADGLRLDSSSASLAERSHAHPANAPSAVYASPESQHEAAVVFFHGWSLCAQAMLDDDDDARCYAGDRRRKGWRLATSHAESRSRAALVVPQLAWLARDSSPGRFAERGFFARWAAALESSGAQNAPRVGAVLARGRLRLYAHSGGFATLLAALRDPDVRARAEAVVMLDALYAGADELAAWHLEDRRRRVVVLHTAQPRTTEQAERLRARLERSGVSNIGTDATRLRDEVAEHVVVIARTRVGHGSLPQAAYGPIESALDVSAVSLRR